METLYIISFCCTILGLGILFIIQNQSTEFEKTLKLKQEFLVKKANNSSYLGD